MKAKRLGLVLTLGLMSAAGIAVWWWLPRDIDTRLHMAARYGVNAEVRRLLTEGCDINARDSGGFTPLFHAAERKEVETVIFLLEKGADPNKSSPLAAAVSIGSIETMEILVKAGAKTSGTPVVCAVDAGQWQALKYLVEHGADVNVKGGLIQGGGFGDADGGYLPLVKAVAKDSTTMVTFLLEHGARPNAFGDGLIAAIHRSAISGNTEVAKMLIDHGADVNLRDRNGKTPLDHAKENNKVTMIDFLREHGAKK